MTMLIEKERTLLEFLRPKQSDRYSKLEAYCDLLSRCVNRPFVYHRFDTQILIEPGQFVSTIIELSAKWGWHRPTTKTFLDGLKALDVIDYKKHYSCIIFTMKRMFCFELPMVTEKDYIIAALYQYERYFNDMNEANEFDNFFERFYENNTHSAYCTGLAEKGEESSYELFSSLTFRILLSLYFLKESFDHNSNTFDFTKTIKSIKHFKTTYYKNKSTHYNRFTIKFADKLYSLIKHDICNLADSNSQNDYENQKTLLFDEFADNE